jgi:hypothetical protein
MLKLEFLLLIPLVRFLINFNRWFYLKEVLDKHDVYLDGNVEGASGECKQKAKKACQWIINNKLHLKAMVLQTGVADQKIIHPEPIGWGQIQNKSFSPLDNLLVLNEDLLMSARNTINVAKGYYWTEAWLSLSPLFWIELVVYLPKHLIKSLQLDDTKAGVNVVTNVIQVIYWVVGIIYTVYKLFH